jgi:hypothetical protein
LPKQGSLEKAFALSRPCLDEAGTRACDLAEWRELVGVSTIEVDANAASRHR